MKHLSTLLILLISLIIACDADPGGAPADVASPVKDTASDETMDAGADESLDAAPSPDVAAGPDTGADAADPLPDATDAGPADVQADVSPPPELVWGPCDVSEWWPTGYPKPGAKVECTTVEVPLDHGDPAGETVALRVGRQRAKDAGATKAIFHLAGGPGGASTVQSGIIPSVLGELLTAYDQVYVDQRGTGGSGRMDCSKGYPETRLEWEACAKEFGHRDLNHYLTVDAAHDIEAVRARLGYGPIVLRGGSYGTRLGLEIMRQHPASISAVVLDGLAPPDVDLLGEDVKTFDHGVAMLVADCEASEACTAASPSLGVDLLALRAQIVADPPKIRVGGLTYTEDEELYLTVVQGALFAAQPRAKLPRAIHEAALGDPASWYALMSSMFGAKVEPATVSDPAPPWRPRLPPAMRPGHRGTEYVAAGLFMTVMCAEWVPICPGPDAMKATLAEQAWPYPSIIDIVEACPAWDVDPVDEALHAPVTSDIPTLLVSGRADLNTYWEWGDHAAETLSNGAHVVIPWATHSTMSTQCGASVMAQFILADGDMAAVDVSCVDAIPEPSW